MPLPRGQQPAERPDELEQAGGLGALLLEDAAPGLESLGVAADPAELPQPGGERGWRLGLLGRGSGGKARRQGVDIQQDGAEAAGLARLARLRLDRAEGAGGLGVDELQQTHVLHGGEHAVEVLARAEDAGADHGEDHGGPRRHAEASTWSKTQAARRLDAGVVHRLVPGAGPCEQRLFPGDARPASAASVVDSSASAAASSAASVPARASARPRASPERRIGERTRLLQHRLEAGFHLEETGERALGRGVRERRRASHGPSRRPGRLRAVQERCPVADVKGGGVDVEGRL